MTSTTPTLRPLKKGDPCYVRIQRRGRPVLAVYDGPASSEKEHIVEIVGGDILVACMEADMANYDCIFVAKLVGEKTTGVEQ